MPESEPSKKEFLDNLYGKLAVAEEDLKSGRVSDADDAINEIKASLKTRHCDPERSEGEAIS